MTLQYEKLEYCSCLPQDPFPFWELGIRCSAFLLLVVTAFCHAVGPIVSHTVQTIYFICKCPPTNETSSGITATLWWKAVCMRAHV